MTASTSTSAMQAAKAAAQLALTRAEHDFPAPQAFDLSRYRDRAPWQLEGDEQTAWQRRRHAALRPTWRRA